MHAELTFAARLVEEIEVTGWDADALRSLAESPGGVWIVRVGEGFAIGRVVADEAELILIAVISSGRRRGIGRQLLSAFEDDVRDRGAVIVHLEVRATNAAAVGLYSAAGYAAVGRRPAYYRDGTDALLMARKINAASRT